MKQGEALPRHLFISEHGEGELFDTRRRDWSGRPVRAPYRKHYREIRSTLELRATLRAGACVFPGGYSLALVELESGDVLCFDCVRREYREHAWHIHDRRSLGRRAPCMLLASEENEDSAEHCADCGALLWEGGGDE